MKAKKPKISLRQEKLIERYLIHGMATRAAKEAGYPTESWHSALKNLINNKKGAKEYIERKRKEMLANLQIDNEVETYRMIETLKEIAYSDIADVFDDENNIRSVHDIPEFARKAIREVSTHKKIDDNGNAEINTKTIHYDKLKALELLGRAMGAFNADKSNQQSVVINFDPLDTALTVNLDNETDDEELAAQTKE